MSLRGQSDSDGLSGKMGSLGSLASLAGVNLSQGSGGMAYSLYLEGVHSRNLANAVAKHDDLMRAAFPKEWNAGRNEWQQPTGPLRSLARMIRAAIGKFGHGDIGVIQGVAVIAKAA